ncbi:hypothetical protein ACFWAT_06220 [Streptomyces syringium]|uniref:hypothetical protein n=1 Tax=Streptomyces syringium TaxID=76729 RepID=UPI00365DDC6C
MPPSIDPSIGPATDPSADRTALDLLDAYLEARWDGRDLPLPDDMVGDGGDGAGELVHWALGRFRSIPCEPKADFGREVGSLLTEFRGRRCPWNAAALRLLGDVYAFAATGPRRQEDWARDALAVLHRAVPDPRGWVRLDCDRNNSARHAVPAYPFDPPAAWEFPDRLYRLEREAAVAALAVMAEEWQAEPAPVRSRPDRDAVLADARTLLDRYGPAARYWTNVTAAASNPAPDFLAAGLQGTRSHGFITSAYLGGLDLLEDLGLIAVTDDEVGVFWSIGAY